MRPIVIPEDMTVPSTHHVKKCSPVYSHIQHDIIFIVSSQIQRNHTFHSQTFTPEMQLMKWPFFNKANHEILKLQ